MLRKARTMFLDALYPPRIACFACEEDAALDARGLCEACASRLELCADGLPLPGLDGAAAALQYNETAERMIHRFKYSGHTYLADFFAPLMQIPAGWEVDAIIPTPLYRKKQRQRGYNQSLLLAERIAAREGLALKPQWLERLRDTGTQTALSAEERRQNVTGAFAADAACARQGILLIDDVITTGSTISACATALYQTGAKKVYALSACRV